MPSRKKGKSKKGKGSNNANISGTPRTRRKPRWLGRGHGDRPPVTSGTDEIPMQPFVAELSTATFAQAVWQCQRDESHRQKGIHVCRLRLMHTFETAYGIVFIGPFAHSNNATLEADRAYFDTELTPLWRDYMGIGPYQDDAITPFRIGKWWYSCVMSYMYAMLCEAVNNPDAANRLRFKTKEACRPLSNDDGEMIHRTQRPGDWPMKEIQYLYQGMLARYHMDQRFCELIHMVLSRGLRVVYKNTGDKQQMFIDAQCGIDENDQVVICGSNVVGKAIQMIYETETSTASDVEKAMQHRVHMRAIVDDLESCDRDLHEIVPPREEHQQEQGQSSSCVPALSSHVATILAL